MFDFYFRIGNHSISINPRLVQVLKWVDWDTVTLFEWRKTEKKPKSKTEPEPIITDDDDDFDPIPF